ncbi:hypothetical protein Tco_0408769 [Tanacetum coccineum]
MLRLGYLSELKHPYHFLQIQRLLDFLLYLLHHHYHSPHGRHHYLRFPHHHYLYHHLYLYHLHHYLLALFYPLGYRAAMIWLRAETPSTSHPLPLRPPIVLSHTRESVAMMRAAAPSTYILAPRSGILPSETPPLGTPPLLPILLPTPSPSLLLPSTDCRAGVSKATLLPRKRLCIALGLRYEVGKSSSTPTARPTGGLRADHGFVSTLDDDIRRDPERYVGYGITDTWEDMVEDIQGTPTVTDVADLSQRMIDFVTTVRQDTYVIYRRLDDAQDDKLLMSGRLNMLFRDRRAHAHIALLMEKEARLSREAWDRSMEPCIGL